MNSNRNEYVGNQTDTASVVFGMHVIVRKKKLIGIVVNIGWFKEQNVRRFEKRDDGVYGFSRTV